MDIEEEMQRYSDQLEELRQRLGECVRKGHDNRALWKWLKARNFDITAAEEMYRKSLEWRRQVGADTLLKDFEEPEVMKKYYPGGLLGVAKDGCPIWVEPMGRGDLRGILASVPRDEVIKAMTYRMELLYDRFRQLTEEQHRTVDQCVHIIDVEGYGSKHLYKSVLDMYVAVLNILENNYPETLQASYIVNYNWKQTLLTLIDADQLPVAYGGTMVDDSGDPMCGQLICCGGEVPKQYYMSERVNSKAFCDGKSLINETVGRRCTLCVEFDSPQETAAMRWGFYTASGDIWFTIHYRELSDASADHFNGSENSAEKSVVQPAAKYNCATQPAEGLLICDAHGKYILEFFNPSFLFTRSVTYWVEMVGKDVNNSSTVETAVFPSAVKWDGPPQSAIADDKDADEDIVSSAAAIVISETTEL